MFFALIGAFLLLCSVATLVITCTSKSTSTAKKSAPTTTSDPQLTADLQTAHQSQTKYTARPLTAAVKPSNAKQTTPAAAKPSPAPAEKAAAAQQPANTAVPVEKPPMTAAELLLQRALGVDENRLANAPPRGQFLQGSEENQPVMTSNSKTVDYVFLDSGALDDSKKLVDPDDESAASAVPAEGGTLRNATKRSPSKKGRAPSSKKGQLHSSRRGKDGLSTKKLRKPPPEIKPKSSEDKGRTESHRSKRKKKDDPESDTDKTPSFSAPLDRTQTVEELAKKEVK